jgi:hypothetical protein
MPPKQTPLLLRRDHVGGSAFACDPELSAAEAAVLWRPELLPIAVILAPAPDNIPTTRRLDPGDLGTKLTEFQGSDGRHVVLLDLQGNHRVWLRESHPGEPLAALLPLDEDLPLRAAGLLRLQRRLTGRAAGSLPQAWSITPRQRRRLVLMLRALDGHLSSATYREIAGALYGLEPVARYPWKTSSIRGQTIRLVRDANAIMNGEYRKLLRGDR